MLRAAKPFISHSSLLTIYYSLFHSVLSYGIVFWGQSANTQKLFIIQKRAIRIIMGIKKRISCRGIFKKLEILPLKSQYIYSLLQFIIKHKHVLTLNSDIHSMQTRQKNDFLYHLLLYRYFRRGFTSLE
jgi:hypothetical protein